MSDFIHRLVGYRFPLNYSPWHDQQSKAGTGRYSYTVALIDAQGLFCGGALIARDLILTAAHCGDGKPWFDGFIGSEFLSDRFGGRRGEMLYPTKGWIHPNFSWATMDNDFAIFQLPNLVRSDVEVARLNNNARAPARAGDRLTALGWGDTNPGPGYAGSDFLRKVAVGYIPNDQCLRRTGRVDGQFISYAGQVSSRMICALDRGKDGCQGEHKSLP